MPSWVETLAAMSGLKRLLRFDATFVQWFDRSPQGARRSFGLMIPAIPLFLILRFVDVSLAPGVDTWRVVAVTAINYALSWVMFPLILILIGRAVEREAQAIGALAAYNWFGVALMAVGSVFVLIDSAGLMGGTTDFLSIVLLVASLVYEVFLLRVLMGLGYGGAVLLVIVDFTLTQSLYILLMSPIMATTVT
jgi:hypothetical protein